MFFNPPRNAENKQSALLSGVSLVELVIVVAIFAILVLIALPAYYVQVPYFEVRTDAKAVTAAVQRARLAAINGQRPVRVSLDCSLTGRRGSTAISNVCQLRSQQVFFERDGKGAGWRDLPNGRLDLNLNTSVTHSGSSGTVASARYTHYQAFFDLNPAVAAGVSKGSEPSTSATNTVAVFLCMPGGEIVLPWGPPLDLLFVSKSFGDDKARLAWNLNITATTGQVKVSRLK